MNCVNCSHELKAGAKFCPKCGTKVPEEAKAPVLAPEPENVFCANCGAKLEADAQFCSKCGTPTHPAQPKAAVPQINMGAAAGVAAASAAAGMATGTGRLLTTQKMVSMYLGEPTVGIAKATGTLSVYDDRIQFDKQLGNALGNAFSVVGMMVAKNATKDDAAPVYPLSQIADLRTGKYAGVYTTLVVALKDGNTITFCPALPGSTMPQNIINLLKPYLR